MPVTVSQLAIAPVKGMRLHGTSEIRLGQHGVTGDREFLVIGADGQLLLTGRTPALLQIEPAWDQARDVLTLHFPDGSVVQDTPKPGAFAATRMYDGREISGWIIAGPLSAALSGFLGHATAALDDADVALALFHQQGRELLLRFRHSGMKPLLAHGVYRRSPGSSPVLAGDPTQIKSKCRDGTRHATPERYSNE